MKNRILSSLFLALFSSACIVVLYLNASRVGTDNLVLKLCLFGALAICLAHVWLAVTVPVNGRGYHEPLMPLKPPNVPPPPPKSQRVKSLRGLKSQRIHSVTAERGRFAQMTQVFLCPECDCDLHVHVEGGYVCLNESCLEYGLRYYAKPV